MIDVGTDEVERPETVASRLRAALEVLPPERLIAAPDCGCVARDRAATRAKLRAMVLGTQDGPARARSPVLADRLLSSSRAARRRAARSGASRMQLFTPFELAGKRLRNRIVFPAVLSNFARENRVTPRLVDYYAERAAGGAAMLVTEGLSIHASSVPQPNVATVFDPANFEGFQRLAAAVEQHDCRLLGQLWHVGRQQLWSPVDAPVGVSALPDAYSWSVPHVMTPTRRSASSRARSSTRRGRCSARASPASSCTADTAT